MNVPATAPIFDDESRAAVDGVLRSGWITEGPECEAFTAELLAYIEAPYGCLVSNGTVALMLAIWALDIGMWHTVNVPTLTFAASANAVIATQATIRLYDEMLGGQEYPQDNMAVWLFGNSPPWPNGASCHLIEDAAQAIGCWHDGQHAGTFGDVGCFSFYADKTITTGEGGFVICKDEGIYKRLEELRNHGRPKAARGYTHEAFGINARMTEMQAAIGRCQLRHLEEWRERRLAYWQTYADCINRRDWATDMEDIASAPGYLTVVHGCVPFRFVAMVPAPQSLADHLQARGIAARRIFLPLHRQPFLKQFARGEYPNADRMFEHGILLPVHQGLSDDQINYVCECVREFYHG